MNDRRPHNYKIVIVGKSAVGKSSLMLKFTDDRFTENYLTTIGVDFKFRSFKLKDEAFKLQIWDTAGQEQYKTITKTFYKGAHAVLIAFDITSRNSFEEMTNMWYSEVESNCDRDVEIVIIGTKCDMESQREVAFQEANEFAMMHNCSYFETSAKSGTNVEKVFFEVTEVVYAKEKMKTSSNTEEGVKLDDGEQKQDNSGCCV